MTTLHPFQSPFQSIEYEQASDDVKAIYDDIMQVMNMPFVLNWFKCQASNLTLLNGNWQKVKSTMLSGQIPMLLKQLIYYNVSKKRGCKYCTFVHGTTANSLSHLLNDDSSFNVTDNLESGYIPSSYKVAIQVVTRCALDPLCTTQDDFEALRDEGFSDSEVQELMAQADLIVMLNTMADISGVEIDAELLQIH